MIKCNVNVSTSVCGEWKLMHALQDMEAPVQSLTFFSGYTIMFAHDGKSNT